MYFKTNEYKLLINNKVVHHFTLPNPERTSIYNRKNWKYDLEGQGETSARPTTHPTPEYHPLPLLNRPTALSSTWPTQRRDTDYELNVMRLYIASLHEEVRDLTSQIEVANVTHTEETDFLCREFHSLRCQITTAQASRPPQILGPPLQSL